VPNSDADRQCGWLPADHRFLQARDHRRRCRPDDAAVIPPPTFVSSALLAMALHWEEAIEQMVERACSAEWAVGVGTPSDRRPYRAAWLPKWADIRTLRERCATDDILSQLFDSDGKVVDPPIHNWPSRIFRPPHRCAAYCHQRLHDPSSPCRHRRARSRLAL
jgi:hypothetical protein